MGGLGSVLAVGLGCFKSWALGKNGLGNTIGPSLVVSIFFCYSQQLVFFFFFFQILLVICSTSLFIVFVSNLVYLMRNRYVFLYQMWYITCDNMIFLYISCYKLVTVFLFVTCSF